MATSKGRVCAGLTDFTAGCVSDFTAEEPITPNIGRPAANEPVIVWGLAADGVARVDVIADGKATAAKVGGNAYFVELSDASLGEEAVNAIRVGFADSSRAPVTIKLAPLPAQPSLG